jgi:uncharacterized protein DUF4124
VEPKSLTGRTMRLKLKPCGIVLKSVVVLGGVFLFAVQSVAGVSSFYKWKDDQGQVHFTDDPLKIPVPYRSPDRVETRRGLPPPKLEPVDLSGPPVKDKKDRSKKVAEEELTAMQEALGFLKNDIQRYKKYDEYEPQQRYAEMLRNEIVAALPEKEALDKKLKPFNSAIFKGLKSFLKKSLQKDYETKVRERPHRLIFIKERTRLKKEISQKNTLVEQLETRLASLSPASPAPSQPLPSNPDSKKSGEKKSKTGTEKISSGNSEKY